LKNLKTIIAGLVGWLGVSSVSHAKVNKNFEGCLDILDCHKMQSAASIPLNAGELDELALELDRLIFFFGEIDDSVIAKRDFDRIRYISKILSLHDYDDEDLILAASEFVCLICTSKKPR